MEWIGLLEQIFIPNNRCLVSFLHRSVVIPQKSRKGARKHSCRHWFDLYRQKKWGHSTECWLADYYKNSNDQSISCLYQTKAANCEDETYCTERFSIECHKTKIKTTTTANHSEEYISRSQWELEVKTSKLPEARENASDQVVIGLSLASDWLRKWRQSHNKVKQRKSNPGLISILNWKCLFRK